MISSCRESTPSKSLQIQLLEDVSQSRLSGQLHLLLLERFRQHPQPLLVAATLDLKGAPIYMLNRLSYM